jgi:hypothetical protein
MALRTFNHMLQFSEPVIRRSVPLSIALLCISNPKLSVLDTLSKLSHDPDNETACNSILALGLIGAGLLWLLCHVRYSALMQEPTMRALPACSAPSPSTTARTLMPSSVSALRRFGCMPACVGG